MLLAFIQECLLKDKYANSIIHGVTVMMLTVLMRQYLLHCMSYNLHRFGIQILLSWYKTKTITGVYQTPDMSVCNLLLSKLLTLRLQNI